MRSSLDCLGAWVVSRGLRKYLRHQGTNSVAMVTGSWSEHGMLQSLAVFVRVGVPELMLDKG